MNIVRTVYVRVFSALAAVGLLSSCQEDVCMTQRSEHTVGFYAGGSQTRTSMLPDGLSSIWTEGDQLSLWALNSSGSYTLSNQIFKAYGIDAGRGFFTSTLSEQMPEDNYSYIACYPAPVSVSGSKVTFNLPSVQDGKASSGADIMISDPVQHGPLAAIPDPEDHSGLRMSMNHMMHQFRFFVPEDDQLLGDEKIERILLTFPKGVTGNVTLDVEDPDGPVELTDAQAEVELKLSQPIGVSEGDDYQFACLAFAPVQFEEGQSLQITKAYTDDKIAFFDPSDLKGKTCQSGHSTPVKLKIRELVDYAGIIYVTVGTNNLGENPQKITLTAPSDCNWGDGGSNVFVYQPGREIPVGEVLAFKFETDLDAYKAFSGQPITVTYDSKNALMSESLTMPVIDAQGTTAVSLTVPYLFFEDFSTIADYGFDVVTGAQGTEVTGYDLSIANSSKDDVNPGLRSGWSGARTGGGAGKSIRLGSRVDRVWGYTHTYGRLDSPALSGLKQGATVNVSITFNYSGGRDGDSGYSPRVVVGTTTTAGAINGTTGSFSSDADSWNDISSTTLVPSISTDGSYENVNQVMTHTIEGCTNANRISWQIRGTGVGGFISNGNQWMFVDNIKVQINN